MIAFLADCCKDVPVFRGAKFTDKFGNKLQTHYTVSVGLSTTKFLAKD